LFKEFSKEHIKVSQRTYKNGSLRHHFWFHEKPFKPGFFKEPFTYIVLQITYKGVSKNLHKMVL